MVLLADAPESTATDKVLMMRTGQESILGEM